MNLSDCLKAIPDTSKEIPPENTRDNRIQTQKDMCKSKHIPLFARDKCHICGKCWADHTNYNTIYKAMSHVTYCPWCNWSWCD